MPAFGLAASRWAGRAHYSIHLPKIFGMELVFEEQRERLKALRDAHKVMTTQ